MRKQAIIRIRIITGLILLLAFGLTARLYAIQVVHHEVYETQASEQYVHSAQNIFNRGSIFFTTKDGERVSAASVRTGYVLAVNPNRLTDPDGVFDALEEYLDTDREAFIERATLPGRTYVEIQGRISKDVATEIREHELQGVMLYPDQWRYYPGNSLAAQTIGFTAFSDDSGVVQRGRYGLERYYDDILQREDETLSINFFAEIFTNLGSLLSSEEDTAAHGHLVTTLEPTVSRMLDDVLHEVHDEYSSSHTGGIIMDPSTGDVIAMGVAPSYDNNDRSNVSIEQFRNPLVQDVQEFGSIVKPLTIAAGIDANIISPTSGFYDAGYIELDGFRIQNFDGRARGQVDMQTVLNQSLNTGVSYIVDEMGTGSFRDYFLSLGLAHPTGIDLPSEGRGLVSNLESPRRVEYATASFGQGIAVTPIAMTRALAALGNGGVLVEPRVVSHITYSNGDQEDMEIPTEKHRVYSEDTSEAISRMLTNTVDEALRGGAVALPNHTVAAKTGTAQIANPITGGYYDDKFLHSFFGYFPAYDPKFIVLLYTIEPKDVRYASETLTDPFMDITNFLLNYYQIPPDR